MGRDIAPCFKSNDWCKSVIGEWTEEWMDTELLKRILSQFPTIPRKFQVNSWFSIRSCEVFPSIVKSRNFTKWFISSLLYLTGIFLNWRKFCTSQLILKKLLLHLLLVKAQMALICICFLEKTLQLIKLRVEKNLKFHY